MPAAYPQEFRDDVTRVARACEGAVTPAQIAKDFGGHQMTLRTWIRHTDIDDGNRPGKTREDSTELRNVRRRNRLLDMRTRSFAALRRICRRRTCR